MHKEIRTLTACKLPNLIRTKTRHEFYLIVGIAVGNGLTDPVTVLNYSLFLYELGLVDTNTYYEMKGIEEDARTALSEGRLVDAFTVHTNIHNLNCGFQPSVYPCQTGFSLFGRGSSLGKL